VPTTSGLDALPRARRQVLTALRRVGEADVDELAATLEVTPSAVRQHLTGMVADDLVAFHEVRNGPGRPRHRYSVAPGGHALFPKRYDDLTLELLGDLEAEDPALVGRVFERRRARRIARAQARVDGKPLHEQIEELARILDEDGYLATATPLDDGGFAIVEHNCAVFEVARRYGHACSTELDFIRAVLPDCEVERVQHIVSGAPSCGYDIRPRRP
jgi:DeoR family suf operon transcriptional repressor